MKFQVGEIAIVVRCEVAPDITGEEVLIVALGPFKKGDKFLNRPCAKDGDYIIKPQNGDIRLAFEINLKKKPPDDKQEGIPDSIRQIFTKTQKDPGYTPEKPLRKKEEA